MQGRRHYGFRCRPKVLQLQKLSLGLSSVKYIVDKFEDYTRTVVKSNGRELVKYDPNIDAYYDDFPFEESKGRVWKLFNIYAAVLSFVPSVSYGNIGVLFVFISAFGPKMLSYLVLYPLCRLVFGTLYPAYASYKAVRTKNLKEYVKWMMYWIVFALFTCTETFTDMFLSWFPFYYEVKIVLVLWLLSPATKGSSFLYRKFVHPALCRREQEIDEYIAKAKDQGYHTVLNLGTKGVNYATTVIMQTAIKGGGGLVQQIRKSYSLSDLSECEPQGDRSQDEADDVMTEPRLMKRSTVRSGYTTRRSASESNNRSPIYFSEVDVDVRPRNRSEEPDFGHIKSSEDISSGYSSADNSQHLSRTGSIGASSGNRIRARPTTRSTITSIKRPQAAEDDDVIIEELPEDDNFEYTNMPPLLNLPSCPPQLFISKTNPPFIYQCIGDQIKIIQVLDSVEKQENTESNENYQDKNILKNGVAKPIDLADKTNKDIFIEVDINKSKDTVQESSRDVDTLKNKDEISSIDKETIDKSQTLQNIDLADYKNDECISIDTTSILESYSADSDDEASFGTPDNSPRTKRKLSPRIGRYGKSKAPAPPQFEPNEDTDKTDEEVVVKENLTEFVDTLSKSMLSDILTNDSKVLNPIVENKMRHKSKSPNRKSKRQGSTIGKLLQIPDKIAFWNKGSSKSEVSNSSEDNSRRSSTIDKADEFQTITDLNAETTSLLDDQVSFKDAIEIEEKISKEIIDKSDELQKLIKAKLESNPEYKMISLHPEDLVGSSKSTDV